MGFALGLFFTSYYPIAKFNKFSDYIPFLPLNILFCFGLLMSYSVLLPLFFIPWVLFIISFYIYSRSKSFVIQSIIYSSITLFFTFLIAPVSFIERIRFLIDFNNAVAGWNMPVLSPDWIFGLVGSNIWMQSSPILIRILLSMPIIVLFIGSIYYLFKKERKLFFIFGSYLILVFVFYWYLIIENFLLSPTFSGDGYKAYKLITYFIPIILLTGLYFFNCYFSDNSKTSFRKKIAVYALLCLLILGNVLSASAMIFVSTSNSGSIKQDTIDLQNNTNLENVTSINVQDTSFSNQMWIYYFLFDKKTLFLKTPTYFAASPQIGQWTLMETSTSDIISILNFTNDSDKILINNGYYLMKKNVSLDVSLNKGWYGLESNQNSVWRWTGSNNETPSLILNNDEDQYIDVKLIYAPLNPENSLSVLLDDNKIMDCPSVHCEINNIYLSKGKHILAFEPKLPPQLPGTNDQRFLDYNFENITISKSIGQEM